MRLLLNNVFYKLAPSYKPVSIQGNTYMIPPQKVATRISAYHLQYSQNFLRNHTKAPKRNVKNKEWPLETWMEKRKIKT